MTPQTPDAGCGRSLEELTNYLHTGSSTDSAHMDQCPECQAALAALRRLDALTMDLFDEDIRRAGTSDEPWFRTIMDNLRLETRAGRSIPLPPAHPGDDLSETEGAVIALIRTVGDTVDGATIGKCRLNGDLDTPGAPIGVEVNITALWGEPLHGLSETLRETLSTTLAVHTDLNITVIDISITDLREEIPGNPSKRTGP